MCALAVERESMVVDLARSRRFDRFFGWIVVLFLQALLVLGIIALRDWGAEAGRDKEWLEQHQRAGRHKDRVIEPAFEPIRRRIMLNIVLLLEPFALWGAFTLLLKSRQRLHVTSEGIRLEGRFSVFEAQFAAIDRLSVYKEVSHRGHQGDYAIETRDGRIGRFGVARPDFRSDEVTRALALISGQAGAPWLGGSDERRGLLAFVHELKGAAGLRSWAELAGWLFRHAFFVRPETAGLGSAALLRWSAAMFYVPLVATCVLLEGWLLLSPIKIMSSEVIGSGPGALAQKHEFMQAWVLIPPDVVIVVLVGWVATCLGVNSIMALLRTQERKRMSVEADLRSAREMQSRLIPQSSPSIEGFDLSGAYVPARDVAGDYYDYVAAPDRSFVVPVGDVSGKGVHAALLMMMVKGALLTRAQSPGDLKAILSALNTTIRQSASENMFVSMVLAGFEPGSRTVRIARAGHNPPLLVRASGEHEWISPGGIALGIGRAQTFDRAQDVQELTLERGDVLVLYTDGVTEAMNERADEYGEDRLLATVKKSRLGSSAAVRDAILQDVSQFRGATEPNDDVTMVVVKAE
jgi:serine phosphatase RsbU (regulator of sigma subunit)